MVSFRRRRSFALLLASTSALALVAVTPSLAQAPPTKAEEEARKKNQQGAPPKGQPPAQQKQAQPPPPPKQAAPVPPPRQAQPRPSTPPPVQQAPKPPQRQAQPPTPPAPPVKQATPVQQPKAFIPPAANVPPAAKPPAKTAAPVTPPAKTVAPSLPPPTPPKVLTTPATPPSTTPPAALAPKGATAPPPAVPKTAIAPATTPPPATAPPAGNAAPTARMIAPLPGVGAPQPARPIGTPPPTKISVVPAAGPAKLAEVKQARVERTTPDGRRIIEEPGNRIIVRQNNRVIIQRNERTHITTFYPNARSIPRPGGITETIYVRPDGVRVFSEVDGSGRLVRRYGRGPGGRDIVYVDNRRFYRNAAIGVGAVAVGIGIALALAPPTVAMPRERYIMDYRRASDDDIYETLTAPPVMKLERAYSLDEVRYSHPLRERMRRVDLDTITFEFGSFEVSEDQYSKLERIARALGRAIEKNPGEMYLIEGHTDAVGATEDNLSLSDRRAEAVARVLTQYFSIPMENLVTQGYGEQHLKIETTDAEQANRRVAIRRITPLLGQGG